MTNHFRWLIGLCLILVWAGNICPAQNLALKLDGRGSYVQLPPNLCTNLTEATVEVWVKWEAFANFSRVFEFGAPWESVSVFNHETKPDLRFNIYPQYAKGRPALLHHIRVNGVLQTNEWAHLAAVSGPGGMLLYLNGQLIGQHTNTASFAALGSTATNLLGRGLAGNPTDQDFRGELDELRVWNHRRTVTQIRENMFKRLAGNEPGLEHLWNFDDGSASDASGRAEAGKLMGNARIIPTDLGLVKEVPATLTAITATATPPPMTAPGNAAPASMAVWWVAGSLSALVIVLLWLALMLRRHAASTHKLALVSANPPAPSVIANHTTAEGIKQQALNELTNFAKESLVQGLYSQRSALLEANRQACEEMARMEARLLSLNLPDRIQAYEQRIAELERELATRDGALREMTMATLDLLRQKVADEKKRETTSSRFN